MDPANPTKWMMDEWDTCTCIQAEGEDLCDPYYQPWSWYFDLTDRPVAEPTEKATVEDEYLWM